MTTFAKRVASFIRQFRHHPKLSIHPGERGLLYLWKLTKLFSKKGEYIFVACMPKTGSTFLSWTLIELTGYPRVRLHYAHQRNEHDLYLPKLIDAYSFGTVTQQHLKATVPNLQLLKAFSIRPVILVRNIFDVVPSIRDHLFKEKTRKFLIFFSTEKYRELDEETQLDFIIELGLPWYFNFYASWFDACSTGQIEALWMTYEEIVADWKGAIRRILNFYRIEKTDQEIENALKKTIQGPRMTRINKGVVGRGRAVLSDVQQQKIIGMTRFYPWVDFSRIGISKESVLTDSLVAPKF